MTTFSSGSVDDIVAPVVRMVDMQRKFDVGDNPVWALQNATLDVWSGDYVSITGKSGSGKSTLLAAVIGRTRNFSSSNLDYLVKDIT